jgi:hypothetical protein
MTDTLEQPKMPPMGNTDTPRLPPAVLVNSFEIAAEANQVARITFFEELVPEKKAYPRTAVAMSVNNLMNLWVLIGQIIGAPKAGSALQSTQGVKYDS